MLKKKFECKQCGKIIEKRVGFGGCPNCDSMYFWMISGLLGQCLLLLIVNVITCIVIVALLFLFIPFFRVAIIGSVIITYIFLTTGVIIYFNKIYNKKYSGLLAQRILKFGIVLCLTLWIIAWDILLLMIYGFDIIGVIGLIIANILIITGIGIGYKLGKKLVEKLKNRWGI